MVSPSHNSILPAQGILPELSFAESLPENTDILLVPARSDGEHVTVRTSSVITDDLASSVSAQLDAVGFSADLNSVQLLPAGDELPVAAVAAVGFGAPSDDDVNRESLRRSLGSAIRALPKQKSVAIDVEDLPADDVAIVASLAAYTWAGLRTSDDASKALTSITVLSDDTAAYERAAAIVSSVALARDLVNTPSSHLYPESYAAHVKAEATALGIDVEVLADDELRDGGYGGICAVGGGSSRGPRLVRLTWKPEESRRTVALVGKGITFDTGGISIKPGANMLDMISDMGGSAAMVATVCAAARLQLPVTVIATIPLAENMPGGRAYRPGDVITHYGGKTSEIHNTDAEGRLVLADALVRACEDNPDLLIDAATLTGAQLVALGARTAGVMGDSDLASDIVDAGAHVGEPAWHMPIPEEIAGEYRSPSADLRNIGTSRNASMMGAGYYLSQFVADGVPWAHIDIAGPAFNTGSAYGYIPQRGTGVPVRTLVELLTRLSAQD